MFILTHVTEQARRSQLGVVLNGTVFVVTSSGEKRCTHTKKKSPIHEMNSPCSSDLCYYEV